MTSDPHALLDVRPGASQADIAAAFRRQAAVHHPDRGGDPDCFAALVQARDQLLQARGEGGSRDDDEGLLWDSGSQPAPTADRVLDPLWFLTADRDPGAAR